MQKPILPGSALPDGRQPTLGVMGGGQLGRMFVQAAQRMGYFTVVLDADPASPAGQVSQYHIAADYLDEQGLAQLMQRSAAITTEFENVPAPALVTLGAHRPVAPNAECVAIAQDRRAEKAKLSDIAKSSGIGPVPYAVIENESDVAAAPDTCLPGVLKTATLGYDGKGQVKVNTRAELGTAWQQLKNVPCVLEQFAPLAAECSVVVARGADGQMVSLPVARNVHVDGILAVSEVLTGHLPAALMDKVQAATQAIAEHLEYVGVLCVEFFILKDAQGGVSASSPLAVNEIAPRPHNSGHWSMDGCNVSQFELQVRALCGLPLPQPRQHSQSIMLNILGDSWFNAAGAPQAPDWAAVLALPGSHLHLYGKLDARKGRKMGHLNITAATPEAARSVAQQAAAILGVPWGQSAL
jgi:5-(carboxyamino)imidazole ribonucleotide synthase